MRAIILLDEGGDAANATTGSLAARRAHNQLVSCGIKVSYLRTFDANPMTPAELEAQISALGADLVIAGLINSSNRNEKAAILNTGVSVPVFALGGNYYNADGIKGVSSLYDGDGLSDIQRMELIGAGEVLNYGRRYTLSDGTPIIRGIGDESNSVAAWSWTGTGGIIYWGCGNSNMDLLPILMQSSINDGNLARPPRKSPIILTIDHLSHGPNGAGGTQAQPEIIQVLGDILRRTNGVCYASLEQNQDGYVTPEQIAYFKEYSDVFKYIASHDHSTNDLTVGFYTLGSGANDAVDNEESLANITASYESTKAHIESLGLTVNTDLAHVAGNRIGPVGWKYLASKGFTAGRIGNGGASNNSETYPVVNGVSRPPFHWLDSKLVFNGIHMIGSSIDAGSNDNGDEGSRLQDYQAWRNNFYPMQNNVHYYHHADDFEDPVVTGTDEKHRGRMTWMFGELLQNYCKDVINFGADILDYVAAGNASGLATATSNATTDVAPTWGAVPDVNMNVGDSISLNLNDYITDDGGDATITFAVDTGSLPAGITLNANGTFSGTATTVVTQSVSFSATNSAGVSASTANDFVVTTAPAILYEYNMDSDADVANPEGAGGSASLFASAAHTTTTHSAAGSWNNTDYLRVAINDEVSEQDNGIWIDLSSLALQDVISVGYIARFGTSFWDAFVVDGTDNNHDNKIIMFSMDNADGTVVAGESPQIINMFAHTTQDYHVPQLSASQVNLNRADEFGDAYPSDVNGTNHTFQLETHGIDWCYYEMDLSATAGTLTLSVWNRDGTVSGELISITPLTDPVRYLQAFRFIAYLHQSQGSDANSYADISDLYVNDSPMGPPAGFIV